MHLLSQAIHALGAVFLQLTVFLLFEELTFAGLVRLILAPRPATGKSKEPAKPEIWQGEMK